MVSSTTGKALVGALLAVAVLSCRAAPSSTVDVGKSLSLPAIPVQDVMLYSALNDRRSRAALRVLALAFR